MVATYDSVNAIGSIGLSSRIDVRSKWRASLEALMYGEWITPVRILYVDHSEDDFTNIRFEYSDESLK